MYYFTAVQGETVLFGDNFDYHEADLVIGFYPASAEGYGSVHFGYQTDNDSKAGQSYSRAVNEKGLAWAVNSIPNGSLTPHPEKMYSHAGDNYLYTIIKRASSVDEAIRIAGYFDFGDRMGVQIHIADAIGDAVVVSPGRDGEIAFTRKQEGDGYLLSTNFNLAIPEKGPVDFRWDTAGKMLNEINQEHGLNPEFIGEILNTVYLKTLTTYTLHSNVIDLKNSDIYIYYMSQYNQAVKLNLAEELAKGQHVVETRDLFPKEIVEAGDAAYHQFEIKFRLAQISVILIGLVLFSVMIMFGIKIVKRRRDRE